MLIHRISADRKDQSRSVLELKGGLNAPEPGGTDWPEVLRETLFGADGRTADFARGKIVCEASGRELTISREPDGGAFQATDGGAVAEDLTAENCGEVLTGFSREAYDNLACVSGADAPDLRARLERSQARLKELEKREASLNRKIRDIDDGRASVPDLSVLSAAYAAMKAKLEEEHVPELDEISRLRGAIINIMTAGRQLDKAEAEQEAAESRLSDAQAAVDAMPFGGVTPEEAEQSPLKLPFKPVLPKWGAAAFCAAVALGALFLFHSPGAWYPVAWLLFVALGIAGGWLLRKWEERWEQIAKERR